MTATPTLLALPLEIRQQIYSYLLINKHAKFLLRSDINFSAHALSLTCRQLYIEALDYYYRKNVFRISLREPELAGAERFPSEIAAYSMIGAQCLENRLKRVQHLEVETEIFDKIWCDPVQKEQPEWFCSALLAAKQGQEDNRLLRNLKLLICGPMSVGENSENKSRKITKGEALDYELLFEPLRGKIGTFIVFDQEIRFNEEDV